MANCEACNGTKRSKEDCARCNGKGTILILGGITPRKGQCNDCEGTGKKPCPKCSSSAQS